MNFFFGVEFWENWYILGENDPGTPEFKFIYYNGKTRQNTYEGAFVYSRTQEISPESMQKVYQIAKDAGMDPHQFCRIRNGCFPQDDGHDLDSNSAIGEDASGSNNYSPLQSPLRGFLASTKVSEILGVESVSALDMIRRDVPMAAVLQPRYDTAAVSIKSSSPPSTTTAATPFASTSTTNNNKRAWWYELGDYLENPHRHYRAMNSVLVPMEWPTDIISRSQ